MDYILRYEITPEDIDFLNITAIDFELHNPFIVKNDSGWCDYSTGNRIVSKEDRVIFKEPSEQQITFLQIKFGDRLKHLHAGLAEIYNVAQQHNVDANTVMDSDSII